MKRKILLSALLILLTLSLNPVSAYHEGEYGAHLEGEGTAKDPYLIQELEDLFEVYKEEEKYYALANDIDASETENWGDRMVSRHKEGGEGFPPIDDNSSSAKRFEGVFNGRNHTISGLYIKRPKLEHTGLFRILREGTIKNLKLENVHIQGGTEVGGIVGESVDGKIVNVHVSGTLVGGEGEYDDSIGGVVGRNHGDVINSTVDIEVEGKERVGGIAGITYTENTSIVNSHAEGTIGGESYVGGIVGMNSQKLSGSSANVEATGNKAGGLAGENKGRITDSYAVGTVKGKNSGGLVGRNKNVINRSWASPSIRSGEQVGGLVGVNQGKIARSFSNGTISVVSSGALAYENQGTVINSYTTTKLEKGEDLLTGRMISYNRGNIKKSYVAGDNQISERKIARQQSGTLNETYWERTSDEEVRYPQGTGLRPSEMMGQSARANMDLEFGKVWTATQGYPRLSWTGADAVAGSPNQDSQSSNPGNSSPRKESGESEGGLFDPIFSFFGSLF